MFHILLKKSPTPTFSAVDMAQARKVAYFLKSTIYLKYNPPLATYSRSPYFYPARMRRGKVIGLSVCLSVVVTTKIARSQLLGT